MFGCIITHAAVLCWSRDFQVVLSRDNLVVTRADVVCVNTVIVICYTCHLSLEIGRLNIVATING